MGRHERAGELYMLAAVALWGLLPILSKQAYAYVAILYCAAFSAIATAVFFACMLTVRGEWRDLLCKPALFSSLISGVGIGVLYYGLVFWGQFMVPASTTSVLLLMEVFFSILMLRVIAQERLSAQQIVGATVMVTGAVLVLSPESIGFLGAGELILLAAAAIPPICNYYVQRASRLVGASSILFLRSCISALVLWALASYMAPLPSPANLLSAAPWVIVNGVFVLGVSKILWIEAIRRIPISKAVAMNSLAPLVTLAGASWILNEPATWSQWLGCAPLSFGCWLLLTRRSIFPNYGKL